MKIAVTRPEEDAAGFKRLLEQNDFTPILEPMMDIHFHRESAPTLDRFSHIAITSANGARAMAHCGVPRTLPVFAVGEASAEEARKLGYDVKAIADRSVESLAQTISAYPEDGLNILHIAGTHRRGELIDLLAQENVSAERAVLYDAKARLQLSTVFQNSLKSDEVKAVTFFSPRTAKLFWALAEKANLRSNLENLPLICLSVSIAKVVENLGARAVFAAKKPDQASMIEILKSALR